MRSRINLGTKHNCKNIQVFSKLLDFYSISVRKLGYTLKFIILIVSLQGFTTYNRNKYLFLMTENSTNIPVIDQSQSDTISEAEEDERCGWWWYKPEFLQKFRTVPWAILFLTLGALMQGKNLYILN